MYNSKSDLFVFHSRLKVKQNNLSVSKQGQKLILWSKTQPNRIVLALRIRVGTTVFNKTNTEQMKG